MIRLIRPEEQYIASYRDAFDGIVKEGVYFSRKEAFPLEETEAYVRTAIENNWPFLFAIDTETDRCVGWCDIRPEAEHTGRLGMGLAAPYRNRGIGRRLLGEVLNLARDGDYEMVALHVRASNRRAMGLYASMGFVLTGTLEKGAPLDGQPAEEEMVQMQLELL